MSGKNDGANDAPTLPDPDKKLEKSIYLIVGISSAACILGGLLLNKLWAHDEEFYKHIISLFVAELGVAGFVALLIISTIERFTRSKHEKAANNLIDRIKSDLFYAIYKRHIPADVFAEVQRCLFNKSIYRKRYMVNYALSFIPQDAEIAEKDRSNHLLCSIGSRYELHNISDIPENAVVEMYLEQPIDENMRKFLQIEELKIDGYTFTSDEILSLIKSTSDHLILRKETTIPAGGKIQVCVKGRTIKRKTDMEVWGSRLPSDGIMLQITAPENIKVHATANHSSSLEYENMDGGLTHIWTLNRGIFPFQSIIFWWKAD